MSPQKLTSVIESENHFLRLKLVEAKLVHASGDQSDVSLDELWPTLNFLKALGFREILFRRPTTDHVNKWMGRLESYQQLFIQDPEYAGAGEFVWNELDPESETPLVECFRANAEPSTQPFEETVQVIELSLGPVPPMMSNLSVDEQALKGFINELEADNLDDSLGRFASIFEEYRAMQGLHLPEDSGSIVASVICFALENKKIDRARSLVQANEKILEDTFKDPHWLIRLLEIYEPKTTEIQGWSEIFKLLPTPQILDLIESQTGTKAARQLVKLMSIRVSREHEELIALCLKLPPTQQKILLQWLSPHWRPKYYPQLWIQLEHALQSTDLELIQLWMQALLRCYSAQALEDLKNYFYPVSFWKRLFSKNSSKVEAQARLLNALNENRSTEILKFLKDIRPYVRGKSAHQVEKLIGSFKERKAS